MRLLSLFSGCGGMDIGFEGNFKCLKKAINQTVHPDWVKEDYGDWVLLKPTGFTTVFANDIRPDAKAAWGSYFGKEKAESVYRLRSVVDLVKREREGDRVFPRDIDIITGGFPCQDFSTAGKRRGFNSTKSHLGSVMDVDEPTEESRGRLYMWMRDVITIVEPKIFIAENVKGLVSLSDARAVIERDFASAGNGGYLVVPAKVLYAADYGVPQSRERIIFIGFRKNALNREAAKALSEPAIPPEYDPYPVRTHGNGDGLLPYVTCSDALIGLREPEESEDPSQRKFSKARFLDNGSQGQTEIKMDSIGPTIRSEHHGNIEYRRLSAEHGGTHTEELNAGMTERRLTVRECARLQTFPDDYQFIINGAVSASSAYKIIGNAVPCVMAYNIAMNIREKWGKYFGQ